MDRFFLLGLLLSAGLHTAVVAHVGIPGAGGSDCSLPPGLELRYVEAVTRLSPAAATGEIETEALAALTVPAEEQVAAREPDDDGGVPRLTLDLHVGGQPAVVRCVIVPRPPGGLRIGPG